MAGGKFTRGFAAREFTRGLRPRGKLAAPPPLARSRIPPATQASNIRNVKSNYLKCAASQRLSPPCVLLFLLNFDGRRARVLSSILPHKVLLPSNVVSSESSGAPFSFARLRAKRRNLRLFQLQLKKWAPKYLQHTRYFNMKCYQSPYPSERKRFLFAT